MTFTDVEFTMHKLELIPGDILVVKFASTVSPEALRNIAEQVATVLPDGVRALVVDSALDISKLTPQDFSDDLEEPRFERLA